MKTLISENQYRANLHCHSTLSDGNCTAEELKNAYRKEGYSVLAVTDHEYPYDHSDLSEKDFLMLTGYEAYIRPNPDYRYLFDEHEIHINLFARDPHNTSYIAYQKEACKYVKDGALHAKFAEEGTEPLPREYSPEYVNAFVRKANEKGYICAYNHPVWSLEGFDTVSRYEGFFSMEMCNYSSFVSGLPEYNGALYGELLRAGKRWYCHGSDDNHNEYPFGTPGCDSFGAFTMICAGELTYPAVIRALEEGNFYASTGPRILSLTAEGGVVRVKTSDAVSVSLLTNGKKRVCAYAPADGSVTEAELKIPENAPYFRIHVRDGKGGFADTHAYYREDMKKEWNC